MNVFEDLVVELKEANLLEDTVLEERPSVDKDPVSDDDAVSAQGGSAEYIQRAPESKGPEPAASNGVDREATPGTTKTSAGEFFKKRAVAEVASLQMVEHVLTGVEREYIRIKPNSFDDLKAKLALNKFLHVADAEVDAEEHKSAQFALMQETEAWCSALAKRDQKIYVSSLRQYCENSKPTLSSHAVLALCRFYRNLPYSEGVRAKFDFLITRLFSRPMADETRVCLFKRDEALGHIETLYRDWASVPLYAADEDDSKVMLTSLSFDELAEESENASSFDQLIDSDFFGRLRMFKESIAELFFAPQVAVSAIEANVRIGNSYVKLIAAERQKMDADSIQAKYVSLDNESVSDATARTLQLVDLLRAPSASINESNPLSAHDDADLPAKHRESHHSGTKSGDEDNEPRPKGFVAGLMHNAFAVNKWLLIGAAILVGVSIGLYVWANYFVEDTVPSSSVRTVSMDDTVIREHLKTAKVSNQTLYGLLQPSWDALPKDKRAEYVQRLVDQGKSLGFEQVSLTNKDGKAAAFGSKDRIDVTMP